MAELVNLNVLDRSPLARFCKKVDKRGPDECWPWTGHVQRNGYGRFGLGKGTEYVHRFAFTSFIGDIPDGEEVDHTCHNESGCALGDDCPHRRCCNPAHLEAVSHQENIARSYLPQLDKAVQT